MSDKTNTKEQISENFVEDSKTITEEISIKKSTYNNMLTGIIAAIAVATFVGGEWAYASVLVGAPLGATEGISSAGLGLFGGATFPGTNLQGPAAVNGLQYGITSAGDILATGNAAVTGGNALIQNQVVFTLAGVGLSTVSNVSFQYGTALTEPNCTPPVPPTENPPVGGQMVPIESTALLLAGAQSTTWLIPLVLSAAGIGLVLVRRK